MNLKQIFEDLIHEKAQTSANFHSDTKTLLLTEKPDKNDTKGSPLLSVTIENIDDVYIVMKLDETHYDFLKQDGLIKNSNKHHAHKRCDFLVFCKVKKQDYILLIELKSNKVENVPEKIKTTKAIIAFFAELLKQYYQLNIDTFTQIAILFDRKTHKTTSTGKAQNLLDIDIICKHQGFDNKDKECRTYINRFL